MTKTISEQHDFSCFMMIIVVGCGVIGLTTALVFQERGYEVVIVTEYEPTSANTNTKNANTNTNYTSDKAGAHWFSFAHRHDKHQQELDRLTFRILYGIARSTLSTHSTHSTHSTLSTLSTHSTTNQKTGVQIVTGNAFFKTKPVGWELPWFNDLTPNFKIMTSKEITDRIPNNNDSHDNKFTFGYSYETVMCNMPVYLSYLLSRFRVNGGVLFVSDKLAKLTDALSIVNERQNTHSSTCELIVNCTGMGSRYLTDVSDTRLRTCRGQTLIVHNTDITSIMRTTQEGEEDRPTYILPRGDGTVVLGGTYDFENTSVTPCPLVSSSILSRCAVLAPSLLSPSSTKILYESVGFRPYIVDNSNNSNSSTTTTTNNNNSSSSSSSTDSNSISRSRSIIKTLGPRIEVMPTVTGEVQIAHCYGHGGYGVQSSWGSAHFLFHLWSSSRGAGTSKL